MTIRNIFIIRHGERLDNVYGLSWMEKFVNSNDIYERNDLNAPESLPMRKKIGDFKRDAPLTNIGCFQAKLTGQYLAKLNIKFTQCFSSSAYRCVQTASYILQAMNLQTKINIEPGLFEWIGPVYRDERPRWMTVEEIKNAEHNVNVNYKPIYEANQILNLEEETCQQWYRRANEVIRKIIAFVNDIGDDENEPILIVVHGGSFDALSRQLTGRVARTDTDLAELVSYCGVLKMIYDSNTQKASIVDSLMKPFKHTENIVFNYNDLIDN